MIFMDLTSKKTVEELLEKRQISPKKSLGQNFILRSDVLQKMSSVASLSKKDTALEVGPGVGTLTLHLAKEAKKVIAVEKDDNMVSILKETLKETDNTEVIHEDILETELPQEDYKVVANLPYGIASQTVKRFLKEDNSPLVIVVMLQKEVAQRMVARPGKEMTMLAAEVQFYAKVEIVKIVKKGSFWPPPKVDSAVVKITPIKKKDKKLEEAFLFLLKKGYTHTRKQLGKNFVSYAGANEALKRSGIDLKRRAESLSVEEWIKIAENFLTLKDNNMVN